MPNRILRDGILTSDRVNQLDSNAEVFYRRLMSVVDDYGRYDARVSVLRAALFPLRLDRTREADVQRWMAECQKAGLIVLYEAEGKPCLQLLDFKQQIRAKNSKWPPPQASDSTCNQLLADAHLDGVVDVDVSMRPLRGPPIDQSQNSKRFKPPTVEEVAAYCAERANGVDPARFVDHYTANGWKVGKSAMRDWKAAVRTWERNQGQFASQTTQEVARMPTREEFLRGF